MRHDREAGRGAAVGPSGTVGNNECRAGMHQRADTLRGFGREVDAPEGLRRKERRGEKAGNFGKRRTDEQKAMFAEITRQRWKERPHPMLGKPRSHETIEKMRQARKGRPISAAHRAALAEGSRRRWERYRAAERAMCEGRKA